MKRVAGWVVGALVGWLILSALGEDTAAVILSAAPDAAGDAVAVGLMVGAPVLSIGVALAFGVRIMRNRTVTSCARYVGAAFAAFYCAGFGHWGSPRLEPIPDCRDHRRMYGCWRCCTASSLTHDRAVMIRAECILSTAAGTRWGRSIRAGRHGGTRLAPLRASLLVSDMQLMPTYSQESQML